MRVVYAYHAATDMNTLKRDDTEEVQVLNKILEYQGKHKNFVKVALDENPAWKRTLDAEGKMGIKRVHNAIGRLRKQQREEQETPPQDSPTPPPAPSPSETNTATNGDRQSIIAQLVEYRLPNRKMDFKTAWLEHPDWKEKLGIVDERTMNNFYYEVKRYNNKQNIARRHKPNANKWGRKKKEQDQEAAPSMQFSIMPHCPECGTELAEFFRMYNQIQIKKSVNH